MKYWQPKTIFSITRGIHIHFSLYDCTINKSRDFFFARLMVDIDNLYAFPNQILVKRPSFVFI